MSSPKLLFTVTGLKLRTPLAGALFWPLAFGSMLEARRTPGCVHASPLSRDGYHHTLTVWRDRDAVRAFTSRPMHRAGVGLFPHIATGAISHGVCTEVPDWAFALSHWKEYARIVGPSAPVTG